MELTVYCGAKCGNEPVYREAAAALGAWMAERGYGLVYGGGRVGLMGILADAVLAGGGRVTGVIPHFLNTAEQAHTGITQMIEVDTMEQRKAEMAVRGDVYIALPGGPGTLEEISEVLSHRRLGLHQKPCIFYNVCGYYDAMAEMMDEMVRCGFLSAEDRKLAHFVSGLSELSEVLRG